MICSYQSLALLLLNLFLNILFYFLILKLTESLYSVIKPVLI